MNSIYDKISSTRNGIRTALIILFALLLKLINRHTNRRLIDRKRFHFVDLQIKLFPTERTTLLQNDNDVIPREFFRLGFRPNLKN